MRNRSFPFPFLAARPRWSRSRAFSLIEVLVVIGLIAVLLGLLLPALARTRESGHEIATLANLRSIHSDFSRYAGAHADLLPYHDPERWYVTYPGRQGSMGTSYVWGMIFLWPNVMHETSPWAEHFLTWLAPRAESGNPPWRREGPDGDGMWSVLPSYGFVRSLQGRPAIWDPDRNADHDDRRSIRLSAVRYPASKALVFERERPYADPAAMRRNPRRGVLAADGAASIRADRDATPPVQNALTAEGPHEYHDTLRGSEGRDF